MIYGQWTIIGPPQRGPNGKALASVRCACGTEDLVYLQNLKAGTSTKCQACHQRVLARRQSEKWSKIRAKRNLDVRDYHDASGIASAWWAKHWMEVEPVLPYMLDNPSQFSSYNTIESGLYDDESY